MIKNKKFFKILIAFFLFILISIDFFLKSQAKLKTKVEADNFLNEHFIEIVYEIKDAYETQIISIKNNDLKTFGEQGQWIGGLSEVYSKL